MNIFVITCIDKNRSRPTMWFFSFDKAVEAVLDNSCDMSEGGTNHYAVIEELEEGYPFNAKETWFELVDGKYKQCQKPEEFIGTVGFGMG